ncbi:MAG: DinB family protein [Gemmatimonadales bacterium]
MSPEQRRLLIATYASGPERLERALASVPDVALQWRPGAARWSVHEIIVHCADSEANAHMRLRYLVAENDPLIQGYDQDHWATELDYHAHPLPPALATVRAVRANTVPLLQRLTEPQWQRVGRHTEHPTYGVERWLETYAEHLDVHVRQIGRNVEAWRKQ